ncbi:unnamed protein product [Chironomus riparius]|uniref:Uncharacterized protein n=1 Tax=Chironomus riparius TaxID=315576 RepID=A0A9N9WMV8_9DIPT|nr:unnamed protein product [Chironomus riparius]
MAEQKEFNDVKSNKNSIEDEKFEYKSPRLFRNSFVHKTLNLFYPGYGGRGIANRNLKEKAIQRFNINPTFTSIALNENDIKVSYPTVDVCPVYAIDAAKISDIIKNLNTTASDKENDIIKLIPNFMAQTSDKIQYFDTKMLKIIGENLKSDDLRIMTFKLAIGCGDLIKNCEFKGHPIDCCVNFLPRMSEHGFCYSFNSRSYGGELNDFKNPQMMQMIEFEDHTLKFELLTQSKLFMHSRDEILSNHHKEIETLKPNVRTNILFSIRQTHTSDDLRQFHANFRKCFFKNERKSKFYANEDYTYSGCRRDLVIEKYQKACGCIIPYFRPNDLAIQTYCGLDDLKCMCETFDTLSRNDKFSKCYLPCDNTVYSTEKIFIERDQNKSTHVTLDLHQWPIISFHHTNATAVGKNIKNSSNDLLVLMIIFTTV